MKILIKLSALLTLLVIPITLSAQLFENFETGTKGGYAPLNVTLSTGIWEFSDALLGTADGDRKNGSQSARIRAGHIQMQFDKPNGAGEISFYASNSGFSGDTGGVARVSISTNGGSTWNQVGSDITLTNTLTQYTINVNISGNVRIRISRAAGNRISVDDVRITDAEEISQNPKLVVRVNDEPYQDGETFSFGTTIGSESASFQLRNTGEADLVISSVELLGQGFMLNVPENTTITTLETKSFPLQFESTEPGPYQGIITITSNDGDKSTFELNLEADVLDTTEPLPIAEARNLAQGTVVTVAGWVTVADQFAGPVYFQDETGGMAWYDNELMRTSWGLNLQLGDSIVVTGELGAFNNLLQIVNFSGYTVSQEGNREIEPIDITLADLNTGNYESQLVRVSDLSFEVPGLFSGGTNYNVTDASGAGQIRIDNFTNIGGAPIPPGDAIITGVAGRFINTRQILPRFRADIREANDGPSIITAAPYEVYATPTSITFRWETEQEGHSEVRYGTTTSLELGAVIDQTRKTEHEVTVTGLNSSSTYKVQLRSAADSDTSFTNLHIVSTASPSNTTGQIEVFFSKPVNTSLATYREADGDVNFKDVLIDQIRAAQESAVFAFYSLSGSVGDAITDEIIDANTRGVDVRVIVSGHTGNVNALVNKLQNGRVRAVQSTGNEQQHNKFAVFDAHHSDPTRARLVTSSWNATDDGTFNQQQNMVMIQDVSIARAYMLEFNQMWGGSDGDFSASNAKFSSDKAVVNPSVFWIGPDSVQVRLHFSPQANTEAEINRALSSARENIDLGLNLITRRAISNTMRNRFNDGVKVRGAIGAIEMQGSEWEYLSSWADVHHFAQSMGLLHHKYAIIDGEKTGSNSKVITGSHNWSANANFSNDENTLIIYSERVANEFLQEFSARYAQAGGADSFTPVSIDYVDSELPSVAKLNQNYPNPFNPGTTISFVLPVSEQVSLSIFDITGRQVAILAQNQLMSAGSHQINFDASRLASGVYVYRLQLGSGQVLSRTMTLIK